MRRQQNQNHLLIRGVSNPCIQAFILAACRDSISHFVGDWLCAWWTWPAPQPDLVQPGSLCSLG